MSGYWSFTATASAAAASGSQAAPTNAGTTGLRTRLRSISISLSGTGNGAAKFVVRDGATGVGAIIWQMDLACAANSLSAVDYNSVDLRATAGNALTVESTGSGGANTISDVNASGDYVPDGWPIGLP